MENIEQATLGGGCFWCIESAFNSVDGVISAISGYAGGHIDNPCYEDVCKDITGHAEVVQVNFDNSKISYLDVLEIFFALHDPTQLNRQGNDVGSQYRSAIFYHSDAQKHIAKQLLQSISEEQIWPTPLVTELTPINHYFSAESYHQDYLSNNPQNRYCNMVVAPKLAKFKQKFASKLKVQ